MDLTAAQGRIMGYLSHQKEAPCPRDLEEAFQLSHPTVSGLLSRLEQKDFIRLETDPRDRRCKRIYMLPKGEECHNTIQQTIADTEARLLQGFTPEEQQQFSDFLHRAIANMDGNSCHPKEESEK